MSDPLVVAGTETRLCLQGAEPALSAGAGVRFLATDLRASELWLSDNNGHVLGLALES